MSNSRYHLEELTSFTRELFQWAGLPGDRAAATARLLIRADLMGHTTHGLQLCGPHIKQFQSGDWSGSGAIDVVSDKGAAILWDANYVAPMWVTEQALELERDMRENGVILEPAVIESLETWGDRAGIRVPTPV